MEREDSRRRWLGGCETSGCVVVPAARCAVFLTGLAFGVESSSSSSESERACESGTVLRGLLTAAASSCAAWSAASCDGSSVVDSSSVRSSAMPSSMPSKSKTRMIRTRSSSWVASSSRSRGAGLGFVCG